MAAGQSSIARRNVEFYGNAPSGHTDMVSRDGTAQGIGGARVRASGSRQVYGERPGSRKVLSESCLEAWRDGAAEVHEHRGPGGRGGNRAWRRSWWPGRGSAHGIVASDFAVQSGVAGGAAQERIFDARLANERTQEVRAEGRAQALPVHEALIFRPRFDRGQSSSSGLTQVSPLRSRPARSRQEAVLWRRFVKWSGATANSHPIRR